MYYNSQGPEPVNNAPSPKRSNARFIALIIPLAFAFIGAIFLILGIVFINVPKVKEKKCTYELTGTVIDNFPETSHSANGKSHSYTTYAPVFEYEYKGKTYTQKSNISSSNPKFAVGDEVTLMIDPDDPKNFYTPEDNPMKLLGIIFTAVGAFLIILAITVTVFIVKPKKSNMQVTYYDPNAPDTYQ